MASRAETLFARISAASSAPPIWTMFEVLATASLAAASTTPAPAAITARRVGSFASSLPMPAPARDNWPKLTLPTANCTEPLRQLRTLDYIQKHDALDEMRR